MQRSPVRDLVVGLFVIAGFCAIAYLSVEVGGLAPRSSGGFQLYATFDQVGGLKPRAAVKIAGVKVGHVVSIGLNDQLYAKVVMDLDPNLGLDTETTAAIMTAGLLGDNFVALEPGGAEDMLPAGGEIRITESAILMERLIGKFVNNAGLGED